MIPEQLISLFQEDIDEVHFGNKAFWLNWLHLNDFEVPQSIFLSKNIDLDNLDTRQKILSHIQPFKLNGKYDIAIRSSSTREDSIDYSGAGLYSSYIGLFSESKVFELIEEVKLSDINQNNPIGVILQKKIDAKYAGVAFSTPPQTGEKGKALVTYVEGIADNLVAGEEDGTTFQINTENPEECSWRHDDSAFIQAIHQLCQILRSIEQRTCFPVDIEFAVDQDYNLFVLQCRPITNLFFPQNLIMEIINENAAQIPEIVKSNDKVRIRILADQFEVRMSKAHLFLFNNRKDKDQISPNIEIDRTKYCMGYSTVLLYPPRINGEVQRLFANNRLKDAALIPYCNRYATRIINKKRTVNANLFKLQQMVFPHYWTSIIIVQEFWESDYSGIIKKIDGSYIIDIGRGQFLAKGVIDTSTYIFDQELNLINSSEIYQELEINISSGEVTETTHEVPILVTFGRKALLAIINEFKELLDHLPANIEFALLRNEGQEIVPYLYDLVDDDIQNYSVNDITNGIISRGKIEGKVRIISDKSDIRDVIDYHYHNESEQNPSKAHDEIIFICDLPHISLLDIFEEFNPQKIGFVFKRGSILSHFAIHLRERQIPAIFDQNAVEYLKEGQRILLDANPNSESRIIPL